MSAGLQPGTTQGMIDRWVEAGYEPEPVCRRCGHEAKYHDEHGCFSIDGIGTDDEIFCTCVGFE